MNSPTFDKEHTMDKLHCALQQRFANFDDVVMHGMCAYDNQADILLMLGKLLADCLGPDVNYFNIKSRS